MLHENDYTMTNGFGTAAETFVQAAREKAESLVHAMPDEKQMEDAAGRAARRASETAKSTRDITKQAAQQVAQQTRASKKSAEVRKP
jgi:Skp family chaperone for outer membrane proteins